MGNDRYDDKDHDEQLEGAKADADSFGKSVKALSGSAYGSVEVASFLDSTGLQNTLPVKIREIAAKANEKDTIMLFAAGHGFRDKIVRPVLSGNA